MRKTNLEVQKRAWIVLLAWAVLFNMQSCRKPTKTTEAEQAKSVMVEKVVKKDVSEVLEYPVDLSPYMQVTVFSPIPDRIVYFPWKNGDFIKRGQRIALIRKEGLDKGLDQILAQLEALDVQIKNLKNELLPALIEWQKTKKGIAFNTEASINLADDKPLMDLMVAAGFDQVFIGIETPDEGSLTECNKNQNKNRNLVEDVKILQRAGLQVQGGFIVGFDNDTASIFQRQIDFIQKSGIVTAMVGLLQAPLGTRLYERLKQEGRLTGPLTGDNVDGTTNIIPIMNLDALHEGYKDILANIYSPEHYYKRLKTFLREYKAPKIKASVDFQHFLAVFRSSYHLGLIGKERFQYWKLLIWTHFRRPKLVPLAITLAIYGHHFRKVYELHLL